MSSFCEADIYIRFFFYLLNIGRRCKTISKEVQINEEIREKEVRLIDHDGTMLGVVSIKEALALADDRKLDLAKISPNANPPVCKLLDYGKYRYEMQKKEKEAKKKQKVIDIKEIRLGLQIEGHDLQVKANNAIKFLKGGDKVKVSLRFKGREKDHSASGRIVMERFFEMVEDVCTMERKPELEGRSMIMVIAPKS